MVDIGTDRLGSRGDDFYELLLAAHAQLSDQESARLNARLVLLLANAVGDFETLEAIIARAGQRE